MESHPDPCSFLSLPQLIGELENLISIESDRNGNPWIKVSRLRELFYEKYSKSLEEVLQDRGSSYSLRVFLRKSKRFSLYGNQVSPDFYIALLDSRLPYRLQISDIPFQYSSRRSGNIDGDLLRILEKENPEAIPYHSQRHPKRTPKNSQQDRVPKHSHYTPVLVNKISSVEDLEATLREIVKELTINYSEKTVTVAMISKKFREHYGQPIRTIMRRVCPELKLIDLLYNTPSIDVV